MKPKLSSAGLCKPFKQPVLDVAHDFSLGQSIAEYGAARNHSTDSAGAEPASQEVATADVSWMPGSSGLDLPWREYNAGASCKTR